MSTTSASDVAETGDLLMLRVIAFAAMFCAAAAHGFRHQ
jgi:hypothetical protein